MRIAGLIAKLLLSLLLWPLALGMVMALISAVSGPGMELKDPRVLSFFGGVGLYVLLQIFFWRPIFMYVLGHELTHALAAFIQGGEADHLHASTQGGKVKVTRNNFVVSLAPYFFPIYTFFLLIALWISADKFKLPVLFLLGMSLAFHLVLTTYSMREHQSDITEVGWLFAIPFILALNIAIVMFVFKQVVPEKVSFWDFCNTSLANILGMSRWLRGLF
ncbi:MAG: hypothetical protein V4498_04765 [candidate division FCPU426 bacterium]